jgi:O-antigen/teichoic acid export membrane protein
MTNILARNAFANVLQMLIGAILLFILYRFISTTLGVDKLGVWSVVLATASASRLADLGLSAGVTRFVARDLALEQPHKAAYVVETGIVTLAVLVALVLTGIYPLLNLLLTYLFDAVYLTQALEILPFALVSMWLTVVASVTQSGLDGCQRMVPRAVLVVLSQSLMVMLAFALVPQWGLMGLAWAQIGQGIFLLAVGWLVLGRSLPETSLIPWRWNRSVFREMLGYGANVQAANLLMMLFDPLTKALMAKFGGPAAAGYFEIANQIVLRVRSLIVAANIAIVPKIANMVETTPMKLPELYRENIGILVLVALPIHALLFSWGGLLSQIVLGAYQMQFVFFLNVCALAWLLNTFTGPAYFMNMGSGSVGLNTLSHIVMGLLNLMLGWALGEVYGAAGVAWGYALALMMGSLLLIAVFQMRQSIHWRELILAEHLPLAAVSLIISFFGVADLDIIKSDSGIYTRWSVTVILPLLALSIALWLHPLRSVMWRRVISAPENQQK